MPVANFGLDRTPQPIEIIGGGVSRHRSVGDRDDIRYGGQARVSTSSVRRAAAEVLKLGRRLLPARGGLQVWGEPIADDGPD